MAAQKYYGIWGENTRGFITYGGRVIIHTNRKELEFLFPENTIKEVWIGPDPDKTIAVWAHPQLAHITFPINKGEFR